MSNAGRIANALVMYAADHRDYCPHPSWGADLTGPDNWAYATGNRGRIPGGPAIPTPGTGRSIDSIAYSNQVAFLRIGLLYPYLENPAFYVCAQDREESQSGKARQLFLARAVKVTSYTMSSLLIDLPFLEKRRKLSATPPDGVAFWETNEAEPFAFNDAANNPQNTVEGLTRRHDYGGIIGRFDGAAQYLPWRQFTGWQEQQSQRLLLDHGQ